jgi:hypothetical protein
MSEQITSGPMDTEAWERATSVGYDIVHAPLAEKAMRRLNRGADIQDIMAVGFGANKATLDFLVLFPTADGLVTLERILIATVRAVCRGADCPINDDGTPFEGPFV